jgi:hypothetical protein
MNSSEITSAIHNKLENSSNPEVREIWVLMKAIFQKFELELAALKQQVSQLQQRR